MATRKRVTKKDEPESSTAAAEQPAEVKPAEPPPEAETVEQPEVVTGNEPNVIWRGDKEPPDMVRIGMAKITMPDARTQRAGFYSEAANRLVRQINGYKFIKPLGTK